MEHRSKRERRRHETNACRLILTSIDTFSSEDEATRLFLALCRFSQVSKSAKNYFNDALLLASSRYAPHKPRFDFMNGRIRYYILENKKDELFEFMNLVAAYVPRREAVELLNSYLVTITKQFPIILEDYIDFFNEKKLHISRAEYLARDLRYKIPFPGFSPRQIERALKTADENNNQNATLVLFEKFLTYFDIMDQADVDPVREAIEKGVKLNFNARIAERIRSKWNRPFSSKPKISTAWLQFYLIPRRLTFEEAESLLYGQMHPGNFSRDMEERSNCILTFKGSTIIVERFSRNKHGSKSLIWKNENFSPQMEFSRFIIKPIEPPKDLYIYEFYKALINNDFEKVQQIQEQHSMEFHAEKSRYQPNPVTEYFQKAKEFREEIVKYLCEHGASLQSTLHEWNRLEMLEDPETRKLIVSFFEKGATTNSIGLIRQLLRADPPRTKLEFEWILNAIHPSIYSPLANFLFSEFKTHCKNIFPPKKLLLLLAWRYGDEECLIKTLPFEILRLILEFVDEPPMFYQYAEMLVQKCKNNIYLEFDEDLKNSVPYVRRFMSEYPSKTRSKHYWIYY